MDYRAVCFLRLLRTEREGEQSPIANIFSLSPRFRLKRKLLLVVSAIVELGQQLYCLDLTSLFLRARGFGLCNKSR